jgi:ABC-type transport system substrate-binding protein
MSLHRRTLLQGTAAAALAPATLGAATAAKKILRLAFPAPESTFDPPQTNSDLYSSTLIQHILEAPLAYDYLARPVRLQTNTAAAMPEVSADGRSFTVHIQPGIWFQDDPAFKGASASWWPRTTSTRSSASTTRSTTPATCTCTSRPGCPACRSCARWR